MEALMAHLEGGGTLVTVNRRLARRLRRAYGGWRRERSAQGGAESGVWESPDVLPWGAWLERQWERRLDGGDAPLSERRLLLPEQEAALWEQAVRASEKGARLLKPDEAAKQAMAGWRALHQWRIPLTQLDPGHSEEAAAFRGWAIRFEALCRDLGRASRAGLGARLAEGWREGGEALPAAPMIWAGFDALTPEQQYVRAALEARGASVQLADPPTIPAASTLRVRAPDPAAEAAACANWARQRLEAGGPGIQIGVVVPRLGERRKLLERAFQAAFHPGMILPGGGERETLYDFSLGPGLAERPLVGAALAFLACRVGPVDLHRAGAWLLSPWFAGGESEWAGRGRVDRWLREMGFLTVAAADLPALIERSGIPAPILVDRLARLQALEGGDGLAGAALWATRFSHWLKALGWPGERPLSGGDGQAVEAWGRLLGRFQSLEACLPPLSAKEAFHRLRRLARETPFQRSSGLAPVQILGTLEAAGTRFDHLWIWGLSDAVWPPPPSPNPFLPLALQKAAGMPHASVERELAFAGALTDSLLSAAPEVVASWPALEEGREQGPSPLIAALPEEALERVAGPPLESRGERLFAAARIEAFTDFRGPAKQPAEKLSRGSGVFKAQALCPFQAFARYRLGGEALPEPEPGLTPEEKGRVIHDALDRLWGELGDSASLGRAMADGTWEKIVGRAVEAALRRGAGRTGSRLTPAVLKLERRRLISILSNWLKVESQRQEFTVISREYELLGEVAGLPLALRVDRVDRLASGGEAIIDYKTGRTPIGAWFGERPGEPQLPLYCLLRESPPDALAFASLRPGDLGLKGTAREALDGLKPWEKIRELEGVDSWGAVIARWRRILEAVGAAFVAGEAEVDPQPGACDWCDFPALCRIDDREAAHE